MKYLKYAVLILFIVILAVIVKNIKTQKTPVEDKLNTEAITDTVGRQPGQKLNDYIAVRKHALESFSMASPDTMVIGMISMADWLNDQQAATLIKNYKITPIAIQYSFRSAVLSSGEIRLEGRSLQEAYQEAMDTRLARKDKNNLPTHGMGDSPDLEEKVRNDIKRQWAEEEKAIKSGQPLIYGLLISGRATDLEKISNDSKIRLVDALPSTAEEINHVPLEMRMKLKPYRPEEQ